jgi:hypothetical protein
MFYYEDTNQLSKSGESQRRVVVAVRKVTYLTNHPNPKVIEPVASVGFETVREMIVSPDFNCPVEVVEHKTVDNRHVVKRVKKVKKTFIVEEKPEY